MTTDGVCERVRQTEGIDQSMVAQYTATIKKVRIPTRSDCGGATGLRLTALC